MKKYFLALVAFSCVLISCKSAPVAVQTSELSYTAGRLKVMDLDEISDLMLAKSREFKKTDNPQALKDGLVIAFGRPDEDSVLEKVLSTIRTPMEDHDLWEPSVEELVDKSIAAIKEDTVSAADQVTYGVVLENIIAQFKPDFVKQYKSPGFESRIIEKIANSEIEFSRAAAAERKLNFMKGNLSPSLFAQRLIDRRESALKK
ncbi:MAG: hypothetical protein H7328_13830 [Bdellovibrio sp.]|nr:hypothetical protein [Bdellovibrio sp.]